MGIRVNLSDLVQNRGERSRLNVTTLSTDEVEEIIVNNDTGASPEEIFRTYDPLITETEAINSPLFNAWSNHPENIDGDNEFIMPSAEAVRDQGILPFLGNRETTYLAFPEDDRIFSRRNGEDQTSLYNEIREELAAPNGEFSPYFRQGSTGDCWLLTTLFSLGDRPGGRQILDEMMEINPDGSVTVHFRGSGDEYTITAEDVASHETGEERLSSGDPDYRAVERAMNLHLSKLHDAPLSDYYLRHYQQSRINNPDNPVTRGGWMHSQPIRDLLGGETGFFSARYEDESEFTEEVLNMSALGMDSVGALALYAASNETSDRITEPGFILRHGFHPTEPANMNLHTNHAYAITDIDRESRTISIVNPHNASRTTTLSYDEFINFFNRVQFAHEASNNSEPINIAEIWEQNNRDRLLYSLANYYKNMPDENLSAPDILEENPYDSNRY